MLRKMLYFGLAGLALCVALLPGAREARAQSQDGPITGSWAGSLHWSTGSDDTSNLSVSEDGNGNLSGVYDELPIVDGRRFGSGMHWRTLPSGGFQVVEVEGRLINGVLVLSLNLYEQGQLTATGSAELFPQ